MLNIKKFLLGLQIVPKTTSAADTKGELEVIDGSGKINYHNGTSVSPIVTEAHAATLTNKTFNAEGTGNSLTNIKDSNIKAGAAIARSKIAAGTASAVVVNDASGNLSNASGLTDSTNGLVFDSTKHLEIQPTIDSTSTGADAVLQAFTAGAIAVANPSLTSIANIPAGASGQLLTLINRTGGTLQIKDSSSALGSASSRILTGTGATVYMSNNTAAMFAYDSTFSKWQIIGRAGTTAIKDEGTSLVNAASSLNFVGAGVTATASGSDITVTIPGATSTLISKDEGVTLSSATTSLNFAGAGITATASGDDITVTVPAITSKDEGLNLTTATSSLNFVGAGVTATTSGNDVTVTIPGGSGSAITTKDEGTNLSTATSSLNFVGAGVTATASGNDITVTIPGGSGSAITTKDEGSNLTTATASLNFVGAGVTATASVNDVTITIPAITTKDEGVNLTTATSSLNFVGSGVTATASGNDVTVTINSSGGGATTPYTYASGSTFDFSQSSNIIVTSPTGTSFTLGNVTNGGSYTLAFQDVASSSSVGFFFSKTESGSSTALTPLYNPPLSSRTLGKQFVMSFLRMGDSVYVNWQEF